MRQTFNIAFYCRESKMNQSGLAPIECRISKNNERIMINLPLKCAPYIYNKASRRPIQIDKYISEVRERIEKIVSDFGGESFTLEELKNIFLYGEKHYLLEEVTEEFLSIYNNKNFTFKHKMKYVHSLHLFKTIAGNIEVKNIQNKHIVQFVTYCESNFKTSTSEGYVARLKTFINYCISNKYIKDNPFFGVTIKRAKSVIEYLDDKEMSLLSSCTLSDSQRKVADLAIFMASTGLSYIDLYNLSENDIQVSPDGVYYIHKKRQKTGVDFYAVVLEKGVEVWNKYNHSLPVISNQKMNKHLKDIQKEVGLNKTLHCHLFRKTYATHLLNSGCPMILVSKALGHSRIDLTASTYAHFFESSIISQVANSLK